MNKPLCIYLIAGEPSGDLLGSRIMRALKKQTNNAVCFEGVGGETMTKEGLSSLFDIKDLAVMGFVEVLPSIPRILKHLNEIITDIRQKKPDIIMTIDSFSFSIRVHQKLKKNGIDIPHIHCVAPQVWAWKKERAKTLGQYVQHLFCLLPSEPAYFTPYGLTAEFVGHPVIEGGADKGNAPLFRQKYNISDDKNVLCLLPGSRKNEIKYLVPIFKSVVERLYQKYPNLVVVIPTVDTVADKLKTYFSAWHVPYIIVRGEKERYDSFAAAQMAIAASGTVSLELALAGVPHLIAYKVSKLSGWLARKLLKIKYVNLINLQMDKEIIPELLQEDCTVEKILETTENLIQTGQQETTQALSCFGIGSGTTPSEKIALKMIEMVEKNGRA